MKQLVVVYTDKAGERHVYATAYDQSEANMQRAYCNGRYPGAHATVREDYPPARSRS